MGHGGSTYGVVQAFLSWRGTAEQAAASVRAFDKKGMLEMGGMGPSNALIPV